MPMLGAARRALKCSRFAAEDLTDEAAHSIKQHPLQAVGITFGLAFGVGALFGWIALQQAPNRPQVLP